MAQREEGNLPVARIKVSIVADAESIDPLLHGGRDRTLDLAFARGLDNDDLQPEAARGGLRTLDDALRDGRIVRMHQQSNFARTGKELMQQLQSLRCELDSEHGH